MKSLLPRPQTPHILHSCLLAAYYAGNQRWGSCGACCPDVFHPTHLSSCPSLPLNDSGFVLAASESILPRISLQAWTAFFLTKEWWCFQYRGQLGWFGLWWSSWETFSSSSCHTYQHCCLRGKSSAESSWENQKLYPSSKQEDKAFLEKSFQLILDKLNNCC